jgi:hypothetical protein
MVAKAFWQDHKVVRYHVFENGIIAERDDGTVWRLPMHYGGLIVKIDGSALGWVQIPVVPGTEEREEALPCPE